MSFEEMKLADFPGLGLDTDPVNPSAHDAQNVDLWLAGELDKRSGYRRANHLQFGQAVVAIPDCQRVCDYRRLLVIGGYLLDPVPVPGPLPVPAPIDEETDDDFWDVNWPPMALFSASETSFSVPVIGDSHDIEFDASESYDPDGFVVSWAWDFGDGGTGSGEIVTHTFIVDDLTKTWTVTLTVTDNEGKTTSHTLSVDAQTLDPWVLDVDLGGAYTSLRDIIEHSGTIYVLDGPTKRLLSRVGPNNWPIIATAPRNVDSGNYCWLISFGGSLYMQTQHTLVQLSRVYKLVAGAWVLDYSASSTYATMFILGTRLFLHEGTGAGGNFWYESKLSGGVWGSFNSLASSDGERITRFTWDGGVHTARSRFSAVGTVLSRTASGGNNPSTSGKLGLFQNRLWGAGVGSTIRYRVNTAAAWVDVATGLSINLTSDFEGTASDLYFVARKTTGAYAIYRYDGTSFFEEHVFAALEVPVYIEATSTYIFLSTNTGKIYRRPI